MAKRILVIDDDFEDLTTIKNVLESANYRVVGATNGAQGLDILKKDGFDLILIDIQMPTLSGYDLLRLLREKLNHKVKMIYVTIVPKTDVDLDGIDGFVQKPFSPQTLLKEIKRLIK
jgi:two-component system response regulator ResD